MPDPVHWECICLCYNFSVVNLLVSLWIVILSIGAVYLARVMFGRWLNPLSIYSTLWGFCLVSSGARLIRYYPIGWLAWTAILVAWFALYVGAGIVFLAKPKKPGTRRIDLPRLRLAILFFSAVGVVGIVSLAKVLIEKFGGLWAAIFLNAGAMYNMRIENELYGMPYVGAFLYGACALAGIYTAKRAKFTFIGVMPLVLAIVQSFLMMARFGIGLSLILFLTAFAFTPKESKFDRTHRRLAIVASVLMLCGFIGVSFTRGLTVDFEGQSPRMEAIGEVIPIFPAIYDNLAAPPVALGQYFFAHEHPPSWFGMYTFLPLFRLLSMFGYAQTIPTYEEFYRTPAYINVMTYLKNVHSDFGWPGIVWFPFFVGMTAAILHRQRWHPVYLAALPFLCTVIVFSFVALTMSGDWYIALSASLLAMAWANHPARDLSLQKASQNNAMSCP